jgi:hypothetical protein
VLLALAVGWCGWLAARTLAPLRVSLMRRTGALFAVLAAASGVAVLWGMQFYVW